MQRSDCVSQAFRKPTTHCEKHGRNHKIYRDWMYPLGENKTEKHDAIYCGLLTHVSEPLCPFPNPTQECAAHLLRLKAESLLQSRNLSLLLNLAFALSFCFAVH